MATLNRVFMIGNLTRDPKVRYLPSGRAVGEMRLAASRRFRNSAGDDREETCYVNVVAWGRQAETCGEHLSKGSPVLVEGALRYEEWEKDQQKYNRLYVQADRVLFLGRPRAGAAEDRARGPKQDEEPGVPAEDAAPPARPAEPEPQVPAASAPAGPESGDDDDLPF